MKRRVLFLCTGNSARSQMAEGILRHVAGDNYEAFSAGTDPGGLNPLAVTAMADVDIDISHHRSKSLNEYLDEPFDFIITVCDRAAERCPTFPGDNERIHWSFDDPAEAQGSEEQRMQVFRRVRSEIQQRIRLFVLAQERVLRR